MDTCFLSKKLKRKGFVNIGSSIFTEYEINELSKLSKQVYINLPDKHLDRISAEQGGEGVRRLPQHNSRIASIINKMFSHKAVKKILTDMMGSEYKIWGIHFRRSFPGESGLYLHQDALGQVSIALSLDDNSDGEGATFFVPGSHWVPESLKKLNLELSHKLVSPLRFLFSPLLTRRGDISIFTNRTWHGRLPNKTNQAHDVILIGMFPETCKFGYENWSNEFIDSIEGQELHNLIEYPNNPTISLDRENNLDVSILKEEIFSLNIENPSVNSEVKQSLKLIGTIQFLKVVMKLKRLILPIIRLGR